MFNSTQPTDNQPDSVEGLAASAPKNRIALLLSGGNGARRQELTKGNAGISIPEQYCHAWNEFAKLSKSGNSFNKVEELYRTLTPWNYREDICPNTPALNYARSCGPSKEICK